MQKLKNDFVQLLQLGHPLIHKLMNKVHHSQILGIFAMVLIEIFLEDAGVPLELLMQNLDLFYHLRAQTNFSHHRVRHGRSVERGACMSAIRPLGINVRVDSL